MLPFRIHITATGLGSTATVSLGGRRHLASRLTDISQRCSWGSISPVGACIGARAFCFSERTRFTWGVIDCLAAPRFAPLWEGDVGAEAEDADLTPVILDAVDAIREAYTPFGKPTDTLLTKVILGTFGCLPACDRFFVDGFKRVGFQYSYLNERFVRRVLRFCLDNITELRAEQTQIEAGSGVRYPLMKLIDMYFWQIGYEAAEQDTPRADV